MQTLLFTLTSKIRKVQFVFIFVLSLFSLNGFAQPANDNPCGAITLTPAATCVFTTYTNAAATATPGIPAPGCASYSGGDVWFQVTVPAGGALEFDMQPGVITDAGMALYNATSCNGPFTLIECDDDDSPNGNMSLINASGLTPGSIVWVRVWEFGNNNNGTFGICVRIPPPPPPPPVNDNPCNAIVIVPGTTCTYTTYTNQNATPTAGVPAPGCASYSGGDVWFQLTMPAGGAITLNSLAGVITDGGMAVYSGTCAGPMTLIDCDDDDSENGLMPALFNLTAAPGSIIWIRFWEFGNNNNGTFGLCALIPPPPPANDNPCNAITLTASNNCTYQTFTNVSATATPGIPAPGCGGYSGGDVWFQITVPCSGSIAIDAQPGTITDASMALYNGTCTGPMTLIDCDDDGSANGAMPYILAENLTPGSIVWLRFWENGNNTFGTFGICASIPPPPGPGDNCSMASSFCTGTGFTFNNNTGVPSLGGGGIYGCLTTTPNPYWYFMQIQNPGSIAITISQVNTAGTLIDVDFALWGPFANLNASCTGLSAGNLIDCSYSTSGTEIANINNGQAGQYYILLVTNFADQPGTITFQQTSGTGSSSCDVVCTLTASNSGPVCPGGTINLSTTSVTNATYEWTGPNCFSSTLQNPTGVIVPLEPGTYVYTVTASAPTPSGGVTLCHDTTQVIVLPRPQLGVDKSLIICSGSSANLTTQFITTGYTTQWTIGGTTVPNPASVNTSGLYQLIATNTTGCSDTALLNLIVDNVSSTVNVTNSNCTSDGNITITNPAGIGTFTYSISTAPGVFQTSNVFTPPVGGPYTITTRDSAGCISTQTVNLAFENNLNFSLDNEVTICNGQAVELTTVSNATTYLWSPATGLNDPTLQSPTANPAEPTTYTVTATLGTCDTTASVFVNIDESLEVNAGPDVTIISGESVQFLATVTAPYTSITWSPATDLNATNILNPVFRPLTGTPFQPVVTYTVTVENAAGCTDSDELQVTVIPYCLKINNAFTPNGDGFNDLWKVYDQRDCLRNISVGVFNRYGNTVFESKDYRNEWDGTYKGKPVPDGTYYAVIRVTLVNGNLSIIKSDLTILR